MPDTDKHLLFWSPGLLTMVDYTAEDRYSESDGNTDVDRNTVQKPKPHNPAPQTFHANLNFNRGKQEQDLGVKTVSCWKQVQHFSAVTFTQLKTPVFYLANSRKSCGLFIHLILTISQDNT